MKKLILSFTMLVGFVGSSQAVCNDSSETFYQIKNGKVIKIKADLTVCGNVEGLSTDINFANGTVYSAMEQENGFSIAKLNNKKAIVVNKPKNIPNHFQCVKNSSMKNEAYCVPVSQE